MTPLPSFTTKHSQPQAPTSPPGSGLYPGDGGSQESSGVWGKSSSLPWAPGCPFRDSVPRPEYGVTQAFCLQMVCTTVRIIYMSFHQQGNVHLSVAPPRLWTRSPGACTRNCVPKRPGTPAPQPSTTGETSRVPKTRPGCGQPPEKVPDTVPSHEAAHKPCPSTAEATRQRTPEAECPG